MNKSFFQIVSDVDIHLAYAVSNQNIERQLRMQRPSLLRALWRLAAAAEVADNAPPKRTKYSRMSHFYNDSICNPITVTV